MRLALCSLVLLIAAAVGCGGQTTGTLVGKIRLGKNPLKVGSVAVYSEDGKRSGMGEIIDDDGTYLVRKAPAGKVKIGITVPTAEELLPPDPNMDPELRKHLAAQVKKLVPIPDVYADPDKSKLTTTVEPNVETTYDIDLKP
ncbi:MAG: hypothetical protein L0Z62_18470 [Gemmataceae bacterium]|nr:hypothetical protein [Gemmataceae bacterium]